MKLLKILILSFVILFLNAKSVFAYYDSGGMQKFEEAVYDEKNQTQYNAPSYNKETFKNLLGSIATEIFGATTDEKYQSMTKGGAIASLGNIITQLYDNQPASSREYFADLGNRLGIVKPAYAQGIGFSGLRKLLPLWKAMRNLAYVAFTLVFLYMGIAIMFRVKLDPKTVITIQNALPKLIIAMILVTFSYAIAGLLIDLIYLLIYLGVIALQGPIETANKNLEILGNPNFSIVLEQAKYANLGFGGALVQMFGGIVTGTFNTIGGVGGTVGIALTAIGIGLATPLPGIGLALLPLTLVIIGIVVLFLVFKLLFALIGCYIMVIISVITAPLQILMGAIPGNQGGFGSWFKNLFANLLVFPAVMMVILLSWLLCSTYGPEWSPPGIGMTGGALTPILGLGMLLLVNKVPEMVKGAFKIKPAGYGKAIGEALGPAKFPLKVGAGSAGAAAKQAEQAGTWASGIPYRILEELLGRASK